MPQVNMEICLFYILHTFGREITMEKILGYTGGEGHHLVLWLDANFKTGYQKRKSGEKQVCFI